MSSEITKQPSRVGVILREPSPGIKNMQFAIYDRYGDVVDSIPQGSVNVQGELINDVMFSLSNGEHVIRLMDNNGKVYAQGYVNVVSADIKYKGFDEDKRVYVFDAVMENEPVELDSIVVKVDGGYLSRRG